MATPELPPFLSAKEPQGFLDLFGRLLPDHYLAPLITGTGPGYELLQAYALVFARVSEAVARFSGDAYVVSSHFGTKATGSVEFYREKANPYGEDCTVKAGTIVRASGANRDFKTIEDAFFAAAATGPVTVAIEAVAEGYDWNVAGESTTATGLILPGEIDSIVTLVEDPHLSDLTIQVRNRLPTTGGRDPALIQHGEERGMGTPGDGEDENVWRTQINLVPDTVSPKAVLRTCHRYLDPLSVDFYMVETWEIGYQTCWDAPPHQFSGSGYDPNLCSYDDPRDTTTDKIKNRWLDSNEMRGAFIVVVANVEPIEDHSMVMDDTAMNASDLMSPTSKGRRAVSVYDMPELDPDLGFLQGCFCGYDPRKRSVYKGLYEALQSIKPAGSSAILELEGE